MKTKRNLVRKNEREDANIHKEKSENNASCKQWEILLNKIIEESLKKKSKISIKYTQIEKKKTVV